MPSVGPVLGASVPRTHSAPSSRCGRNSEPITPLNSQERRKAKRADRTANRDAAVFDGPLHASAISAIQKFHHRVVPLARALRESRKLASTGAINIEKSSAPSSANATVQAMGLNSRPSTRCSVKIGR